MRQLNTEIINADADDDIESAAIDAQNLYYVSLQAVGTGGVDGALKLQASNDIVREGNETPQNWSDIASATVTVTADGVFLIPKTEICYQWIRAVYTDNAGAGTIIVRLKALGA